MKPSEILATIFDLDRRVSIALVQATEHRIKAGELEAWSKRAGSKANGLRDAIDNDELDYEVAEQILMGLAAEECGSAPAEPVPVEAPKPARKARSGRGQPRRPPASEGSGPSAPGIVAAADPRSAIEIVRERLIAHFTESGPMPIRLVAERMGTDEAGALAPLEQDPAFCAWHLPAINGQKGVEVWGARSQFLEAARQRCPAGAVPSDVMSAMGCSLDVAKLMFERTP